MTEKRDRKRTRSSLFLWYARNAFQICVQYFISCLIKFSDLVRSVFESILAWKNNACPTVYRSMEKHIIVPFYVIILSVSFPRNIQWIKGTTSAVPPEWKVIFCLSTIDYYLACSFMWSVKAYFSEREFMNFAIMGQNERQSNMSSTKPIIKCNFHPCLPFFGITVFHSFDVLIFI